MAYVGQPFAQGVREVLGEHVSVQIAKRSELHTFKVMPKRWIVERSFAWLDKNRRLWKNCERWLNISRRCGRPGPGQQKAPQVGDLRGLDLVALHGLEPRTCGL